MPKHNRPPAVATAGQALSSTDTHSMVNARRARKLDVTPVMVSQRTCLQVLGVPESVWSDWVRSLGIPHRRIGQLTLVKVEDALAKLGPEATTAAPSPEAAADPAAAVRDALGLRRRGQ
jgi:hypothetical protein